MKFKISQLLRFLKLKKIFIENALNIDLKDFDYENLNVNTIIEVFIVKKFNIDLINEINDFYSKTTDIREALGLSWDEYLIELSAIFLKYKMHNMYANILNVFLEKNYSLFEKCLLNLKKDKNFDLIKFIFEQKFELKIFENSQNMSLINNINENMNAKSKMSLNLIEEDLLLSESAENKIKKGFDSNGNNKIKMISGDFDKSEFFSFFKYTGNNEINSNNKKEDEESGEDSYSVIKEHFNFKKDFSPEREYLQKFKQDKEFNQNFLQLLDSLNSNFDLENFNNSRHLKGEVENTNNSYSLHPKLIELLDNINYKYRGQEFKLNTNISMKAKLYRKILSRNFCAVENILQWENFSFDLRNLKNLVFLENKNLNLNKNDFNNNNNTQVSDETNLIVAHEDEKIFHLMNLLSLLYTGKDTKFDLIFESLTKIFLEKFEILFSKLVNSQEIKEESASIKTRITLFIMDSVYHTIKNTKCFSFSNILFWRTFIKKLDAKVNSATQANEKLKEISTMLQEIQKEFLNYIAFAENEKNKTFLDCEELEIKSQKSDFILDSMQKISEQFNILLLFGEEFLEKYDFNFKIRNLILKPELDEFCRRYFYFRNLRSNFKKNSNITKKDLLGVSFTDFHLNFLCNVFKNLNLNNIFNFIKIINLNVLSKILHFDCQNTIFKSNEFLNIKHLLGIKLVNNLSNISGFLNVDQSLSFLVFNYLKNYVNSDNEFKELINELLFVPKFNILLDSSSNIILLEKNLNNIVKDYFETKINIFNQIVNLFKDKFRITPIAETTLKLLKIKKFICDSFNSNLRNVFSDISEMDNYQDLENYIKDDRFKKEIYKIYSSN